MGISNSASCLLLAHFLSHSAFTAADSGVMKKVASPVRDGSSRQPEVRLRVPAATRHGEQQTGLFILFLLFVRGCKCMNNFHVDDRFFFFFYIHSFSQHRVKSARFSACRASACRSRRRLFEYVPCTLGGIAKHERHVKNRRGGRKSLQKKRDWLLFSL